MLLQWPGRTDDISQVIAPGFHRPLLPGSQDPQAPQASRLDRYRQGLGLLPDTGQIRVHARVYAAGQ